MWKYWDVGTLFVKVITAIIIVQIHVCFFATVGKQSHVPKAKCFQVFRLSHSCEHNISATPGGNFFKFGTHTLLDSRMNSFEFGGQRSVTLTSGLLHLQSALRKFLKFGTKCFASTELQVIVVTPCDESAL